MIDSSLRMKDNLASVANAPHLSHSRINRYLLCPEQYRLYYIENLKAKFPPASLVFGQVFHQALAHLFNEKNDPVAFFQNTWDGLKDVKLTYRKRESWEKLKDSANGLLEKFLKEEFSRIGLIRAVEKPFKFNVNGLDLPFIGILDLVAEVGGQMTIVDHKTAGATYDDHESEMSDQLTAYKLAEPEVENIALWVFVKTKEPQIEWYPSKRASNQLTDYISKLGYVAKEISAGHFYKRPGMWCSWCDFLPVCLGDKKKINETLVQGV